MVVSVVPCFRDDGFIVVIVTATGPSFKNNGFDDDDYLQLPGGIHPISM